MHATGVIDGISLLIYGPFNRPSGRWTDRSMTRDGRPMRFHISSPNRRFVTAAGAALLLAGLGLTTGSVPAGATSARPGPAVATTTRGPCPDAQSPTGDLVSATSTTLRFSFTAYNANPPEGCGLAAYTTVNVSDHDPDGAVIRVDSVAGLASGFITVTGLRPDTDYWFWFTGGGSPFGGAGKGPVRTLAAVPTPPVTVTTRPTCPDPMPPSGAPTSATPTSLTFSFTATGAALPDYCGFTTTTVSVYDHTPTSPPAAGTAASAPHVASGTLTVTGLKPATDYWYVFGGGGSPFGGVVQGPVRTPSGGNACTASYATVSSWNSGFLGTVTIRNMSAEPLSAWKVGWTFTRGERLAGAYNAVIGGTQESPVLTRPVWDAAIPAGGTKDITILVNDKPAPAGIAVSCGTS
jgi:Cellulose binding domain